MQLLVVNGLGDETPTTNPNLKVYATIGALSVLGALGLIWFHKKMERPRKNPGRRRRRRR